MRILWLKTDLLHPLDRGGRIRSFHTLHWLAKEHYVHYLALDDGTASPEAIARADDYCSVLERVAFRPTPRHSIKLAVDLARNMLTSMPYAISRYASRAMRERVATHVAGGTFDLVVSDFLMPSQNVPLNLGRPTVLFQHNVEAEVWRRHAEHAPSFPQAPYFGSQWRRMARFERETCRRFDHVIAVSEQDASFMATEYGPISVSWVPTGIDAQFFLPPTNRTPRPNELLFVGSLDWMPNVDAVDHFIAEVLPLVHREAPNVRLTVVGRHPPPAVRRRLATCRHVTLEADVPDVRPFMERAAVFIVPIRIGGGTRLKLYEALAMNLPVVTTRTGAEGLPLLDGQHVAVADTPAAQAEAILSLLRDPARAGTLGEQGGAFVRSHFSWEASARDFADSCISTIRKYRADPQRIRPGAA